MIDPTLQAFIDECRELVMDMGNALSGLERVDAASELMHSNLLLQMFALTDAAGRSGDFASALSPCAASARSTLNEVCK